MFNTLEQDLNYGVSQMNAFSVLLLEGELQFTSKNIWITDSLAKKGRSSLTVAQSTWLENRRQTTVQVFPHRNLQDQNTYPAMVCFKKLT